MLRAGADHDIGSLHTEAVAANIKVVLNCRICAGSRILAIAVAWNGASCARKLDFARHPTQKPGNPHTVFVCRHLQGAHKMIIARKLFLSFLGIRLTKIF